MLIPFLVIVTILGIQFNELNAQDLEQKFNECLHKVTSDNCPSFDEVRQSKINQLAKVEENAASDNVELVIADDCVVRPWIDRDWHWECLVPVTAYDDFIWHGPGHENNTSHTRPEGDNEVETDDNFTETPDQPNPPDFDRGAWRDDRRQNNNMMHGD